MSYPTIQLKAGREAATGFHHPWVFSGAIEVLPSSVEPGDLVYVADRRGEIIGTGTYAKGTIAVRIFDFQKATIDAAWIQSRIQVAWQQRSLLGYGKETETSGYRLVHGEGDGLPGLVVDVYGEVAVMHISTLGMDKLLDEVVAALREVIKPVAIVVKRDGAYGKPESAEVVDGAVPAEVVFSEMGLLFVADVLRGQKTGFFLDQKDLRRELGKYAAGKHVLNLFSYTGATAVALLKKGATFVHNIDESQRALNIVDRQMELNGIAGTGWRGEKADVFQWLGEKHQAMYDMVVLDPPALMKTVKEKESAMKAYHFLNRAALRLLKPGGMLATSSCSYYLAEEDLAFVLRRASVQAGRELHLLASVRQSMDHPWSVYFPEGLYLKSFVFSVE